MSLHPKWNVNHVPNEKWKHPRRKQHPQNQIQKKPKHSFQLTCLAFTASAIRFFVSDPIQANMKSVIAQIWNEFFQRKDNISGIVDHHPNYPFAVQRMSVRSVSFWNKRRKGIIGVSCVWVFKMAGFWNITELIDISKTNLKEHINAKFLTRSIKNVGKFLEKL